MHSLSVIVPSYRRPEYLAACLSAVASCGNDVDEVLVVAREDDPATCDVASKFGCIVVNVKAAGLALAMRAGALRAKSSVVAFLDDDARPRPGWATALLQHYTTAEVGGVGGRDQIHGAVNDSRSRRPRMIGCVSAFGQVVGGHHLASGPARNVDHLKGVNCSFRRSALLSLDYQRLLVGEGAQTRNEFVACLGLQRLGYQLIFDPNIVVDHFPAPRSEDDSREVQDGKIRESVFNERLGFYLYQRKKRLRNALFIVMVGYGHAPGIARALVRRAKWHHVKITLSSLICSETSLRLSGVMR